MAAALALAPVLSSGAQAQSASPLRQGFLTEMTSSVRQYSTPDNAVRFILDRSGRRAALVQFEGDPEVHVLRPVAGANGDEVYRSDAGDVQLRVTPHGGVTVYTRAIRTGAAVSEEGVAAPLAPTAATVAVYQTRLRELQAQAQRRLGRPLAFTAPATPPANATGLIIDAAARASDSIEALPRGVSRVQFVLGDRAGVGVRGDTLIIQVAPALGYAGRPSSASIRTVAHAAQGPER
ncbi:MAG: DUF4908 domain-containing protein [Caulobacterales bacterium]